MSLMKYFLLLPVLTAALFLPLEAFDMPCRVYPAGRPVVLRIYADGIHDTNRLKSLEISGVRVDGSSLSGRVLPRGTDWEKLEFADRNGVIEIPVVLAGEFKHTIRMRVRTAGGAVHQVGRFEIYSLKDDLFKCEVYPGDLHIHSRLSDGRQEPERIAVLSIRKGYNFVCITDRDPEPLRKLAADPVWKKSGFTLIPGEELSINRRQVVVSAIGASQRIKKFGSTAEAGAAKYLPEIRNSRLDKRYHQSAALTMYLNHTIRREGGLAVFCQPFLQHDGRFSTPPELREFLLQKGGFDAFEAVNAMASIDGWVLGYSASARLMGREGNVPVPVATQNSRNVNQANYGRHHTLIFAPENTQAALLNALRNGFSVAVSGVHGNLLLIGKERLVTYTAFLRDNYFETHYKLAHRLGNALSQKLSGSPRAEKIFAESAAEMAAYRRDFKYREDSGKAQLPGGGRSVAQQQKK